MSWTRYQTTTTGIILRIKSGAVFTPRSYCDDPTLGAIGVYVTKNPVCKLLISPLVQFTNINVAWDISQSMSTTSTIDTFDIAFGGGGPSDLTGQDWSVDPKTGNVQYTSTGTYTITASVTDVLGQRSKQAKIEVNIVTYVALQRAYIFTTDGGLFILTPSSGPTAANTGLTGNHTNMRAGHVHPIYADLPVGQQHLWAATQDGVAYTTNGATGWTPIAKADLGTPENAAGDDPAPATADLDQIDLCIDPQDPNRIYMLRTTATRAWLYYTTDYGTTWSNEQISV